jgi:hypothetical protein
VVKIDKYENWLNSATGTFLIKKGLNEKELKKQYNLIKEFNKTSYFLGGGLNGYKL